MLYYDIIQETGFNDNFTAEGQTRASAAHKQQIHYKVDSAPCFYSQNKPILDGVLIQQVIGTLNIM